MKSIFEIYDWALVEWGVLGLSLVGTIFVLMLVQLYYYVVVYARIPSFRNEPKEGGGVPNADGVSVVVVVQDDMDYIEQTLPKILAQTHPTFEVIIVDLSSQDEFSAMLTALAVSTPNVRVTKMIQIDHRFNISNKMALNVGIKAAQYENVLLTTVDSYPDSDRWLGMMVRGFDYGDVVLGYCGVERGRGLSNKLIRCSRLLMGVRYLSSAVRGVPYRGLLQNLGFTRGVYFGAKGFNRLNMNIGEDDLFVQLIANNENTAVVMNPHATMRQYQWGGLGRWLGVRKMFLHSYRFYPRGVKSFIVGEQISRALFFLVAIVAIASTPLIVKAIAAGFVAVRLGIVEFQMWRIRKRLNEPKLGWSYIVYDFISPAVDLTLFLSRTLFPNKMVWR